MKMDRRCFLSFGIGASAGLTLSPLPWKLTDDLSIWTQMWPWTPVPPDGEVTCEKTICTDGCGIRVRKVDGRVVKVEGDEENPLCQGGLTPRAISAPQFLYGPTRIDSPRLRTGERGAGGWRSISWDEALEILAEKLIALRKAGTPHRAAFLTGPERGVVPELVRRFAASFGSPNCMRMPSARDACSLAMKLMQGIADAVPGYDLENADMVVSFGCGLLDGWGVPSYLMGLRSGWKEKGVRFVQVEPRLSRTAAKADQWIPVRPGTEALIALGMACVIIEKGLYDKGFVDSRAAGFEDGTDAGGKPVKGFKAIITERFQPSAVAGMTGADADAIEEAAVAFASAKRPVALYGRGKGETPGTLGEAMAVHALNALVGAVEAKGGVRAIDPRAILAPWPQLRLDETAAAGAARPRVDGTTGNISPPAGLANRLPDAVNKAPEPPLDLLLIYNANPVYSLPGAAATKAAFEKIPFIVSFASRMDETAAMADLLLPDDGPLETLRDIVAPPGVSVPYVGVSRPVVEKICDTRNTGDVVLALARMVGGVVGASFPWKSYEDCLNQSLGKWKKKIDETGYAMHTARGPASPASAFQTPDGKFRFSPSCFAREEGIFVAAEGDENAYPLLLISGETLRTADGGAMPSPFMMKILPDTALRGNLAVVSVNPKTGGKMGLGHECRASLDVPGDARGSVEVLVCFDPCVTPGTAVLPAGLGHAAGSEYVAGKGINLNALLTERMIDPVSGMNAAWGTRAMLTPIS
ncbi:MAG: molybdopterin oxidoreductase [Desulfobacterales bacterium]|nr:MAG: molybdopterin oxidoreductase [Desulfobacterales bacterium]